MGTNQQSLPQSGRWVQANKHGEASVFQKWAQLELELGGKGAHSSLFPLQALL